MTSWLDTAARARVECPGSPLHGRVARIEGRCDRVDWRGCDIGPLINVSIGKDEYLLPPDWLVPYKPKARKRRNRKEPKQ